MSLASQVLDSARIHLNDEMGLLWPDNRLLPKLQEAHRELKNTLEVNGIPVIHEVSAILTVPAGTTDLTTVTNYPTDLVTPIWMKERQVGGTIQDFVSMVEVRFIPDVIRETTLNYWCWIEEKITLLGATINVEVQLRYNRDLSVPIQVNSQIGFIMGESYLSYRTAALAAAAIKDYSMAEYCDAQAEKNLDNVVRFNVKQAQNIPVKRRPYHRRFFFNRPWYF